MKRAYWNAALLGIVAVALLLRLHGIADPIMDHPGWRQGDTAAIARNFAQLRLDVMYPQTMYDGPPPNYVELELQIVPFLAALADRVFGVAPVAGRALSIAFSLGTVVTIACLGRWLFADAVAGLLAAFFYAVFPGSVYYGRTFMPDCAMVFFLTLALYAAARLLAGSGRLRGWPVAGTTALLSLAYLAKPVAMLALVPLGAMLAARWRRSRDGWGAGPVLLALPVLAVWLYDRRVASYAEWHWASGITTLHVLPALHAALRSGAGFAAKLTQFRVVLGMLRDTMLGPISALLGVLAFCALPWMRPRSAALLWGWLIGGLAYVFVVVTVERVDYYMLPLLPLWALAIGGLGARFAAAVRGADAAPAARGALLVLLPLIASVALIASPAPVRAYYRYNRAAYRNAVALSQALPSGALVVIGHYGPDLQYYLDRFGWEEDPLLWTPFDEESAVAKGARYFVAAEAPRLHHNLELCAWLAQYPQLRWRGTWSVYVTDPQWRLPGAAAYWRDFRRAERAGRGRAYLDARGLCRINGA